MTKSTSSQGSKQRFGSRRAYRRWLKRQQSGVRTMLFSPDTRQGLEALEQRVLLSASPVFELSDLLAANGGDGSEGVVINGVSIDDRAGVSVSSAGDVNGDGYEDMIIGAFRDSPNGVDSGSSYVIFGTANGFNPTLQLSSLNGTTGFKINGIAAGDYSGRSVSSAGDVNNDGYDDLLIGAFYADGSAVDSGQVYVVYGGASFSSTLQLSALNGTNGFTISGVSADDHLGFSVSNAGDVNGDGIDDFILGASDSSPNGAASGTAYVIFGQDGGFGSSFDLTTLNGSNGFAIEGVSADDQLGIEVSGAGDVNGDGIGDLIVGAFLDDTNGGDAGAAYVIFGASSGFSATFDPSTLNGSNGFAILGAAAGDNAGRGVSGAGDFNGDGYADLIIGAPGADGSSADSGSAYVIFGKGTSFSSSINLGSLSGSNGFKLNGIDLDDQVGVSVSSAGDVNGDGLDDLLISADNADPNGNRSGETYVVFGRTSAMSASINLSALSGSDGFVINGINSADRSGLSVSSAGDVNGDGYDDMIIGAFLADPNGSASGQSYLVYGGDFSDAVTEEGSQVSDAITGTTGADVIVAGSGDDIVDSRGGTDVVNAGQGDDEIIIRNLNFTQIDGGRGTDTLTIDGSGISLDLSTFTPTQLKNIEAIDISGGANSVTLTVEDILNLSNSSNTLTITYDILGSVNFGSGWAQQSNETIGNEQHITYTQGNATLILIIKADVIDPVVTIDPLKTDSRSPQLTGTVSDLDPDVDIEVTVDGMAYTATNNGDGTWTLAAGVITPDLADGIYSVTVTGTDSSGNVGSDQTSNELIIDNEDPVVTIDVLETIEVSPVLTGTITDLDPATTISVTVDGVTYDAVNNGDGTWTLDLSAETVVPELAEGTYEVSVTATDTVGHTGSDSTTDELTIDLTDPVITINDPGTVTTASPVLTGTVTDADTEATVRVSIDGVVYEAVNNGDGTWTLDLSDEEIALVLDEGDYEINAAAIDAAGNSAMIDATVTMTVDLAPVVTVDVKTTSDTTPQITGTIDDMDVTAEVLVTVNGTQYTATNNGDGTWTLEDDTITSSLADGVYDVSVQATDSFGNIGTDTTTDELTIDTAAPTVTVDALITNDTRPEITGTVSDAESTVSVTINGTTYTATNNGDGTWTLADNMIGIALAEGIYDVEVTATNLASEVGTDSTTNELEIDLTAPTVAIDTLTSGDSTPTLTGAVNDFDAEVVVNIIGGESYTATNNGDGTWTLEGNTMTEELAVGTYNVLVTATDVAGNSGNNDSNYIGVLEIIDSPFTLTVDTLETNDSTPEITGTIEGDTTGVTITVTINGTEYTGVTIDGNTWTLADGSITSALADGVYEVTATGTNSDPFSIDDSTMNELTIDTTAPTVTVDALTTSDSTPELTGTVDDASATVMVTVNGTEYQATNNGDGTWTLADDTISPALTVGTYDVSVSSEDTLGNSGSDATVDELIIIESTIDVINLADLLAANGGDGSEGFVLNGESANGWAGVSASLAGDINGDGYDDIVIGANITSPISFQDGTVYVIFGSASGFPAEIELSSLDGTNGFRIDAILAGENLGVSVATAGDFNGDGIDDLIIGASHASRNGSQSGSAYVVYGQSTFSASFDLSTLDGTNGFRFDGAAIGDRTGFSVNTAGDINGDGLADVLIGTTKADDGVLIDAGRTYVIYGSTSAMTSVIEVGDLNGTNGFILTGAAAGERAGFSVSSAGDVNGDGYDDIRIGAPGLDSSDAGQTYIVFGQSGSYGTELNLGDLDGTNGFVILGDLAQSFLGYSGSGIGDFNGDGFDDILVSAPASNLGSEAGAAYVIYGHGGSFSASISIADLDGSNGFAILGDAAGDLAGFNVSGVGDVNGDGLDDLLVGVPQASGGGYEQGESYLLFGAATGIGASIDLATLPGNGGIVFNGVASSDHAGRYVSMAGDVNGDGFADFIVAARDADISTNNDAGQIYVVFGQDYLGTATQLGDETSESFTGTSGRDAVIAGAGDDDVAGEGGPDVVYTGADDDSITVTDTNFVRIDGGSGFDTLNLDGSGISLDLTALADSALTEIEQIDIRGTGDNTLTLDVMEVLNMSGASNTLLVLADSGDTVNMGSGWTSAGTESIDGKTFDVYTQGNATLKVYTEAGTAIDGDLNGDGFVGLDDLDLVLGNWNQNVTPGDKLSGDPSGDGFVGLDDLDIVLGNWNAGTPAAVEATATSVSEETAASTQAQPETVSLVDEVETSTSTAATSDDSDDAAGWSWMHDSDASRSAFGDADDDASDSVLDMMSEDSALSRLL